MKQEAGEPARDYPVSRLDRQERSLFRQNAGDRRQYVRYLASIPVTVKYQCHSGETHVLTATVADISEGGVMLEGLEIPGMVSDLELEFRVPKGVMPEPFIQEEWKSKATVRYRHPSGKKYGVAFEESLAVRLMRLTWTKLRWSAVIFSLFAVSLVLIMKAGNFRLFWLDVPIFLYSILGAGYLIVRFVSASFYRRPKPLAVLPKITVIVPVFNEREHVGRMIAQVMESAYPAEWLQLIVINDGSTDGTAKAIEAARLRYPEVEVITFKTSLGKRHGMSVGADRATGDFLVFIDSDSFLAPDALRNILKPFADPAVAAVSGHCNVENLWVNALTRMQAVQYYLAFKVMKAAESHFDSVTCLSGSLAACRRDSFLAVREEWLNQTFFGQPAAFGDDRSLTTSLLKRGHKVVYADDAITTTIVPQDHVSYLRQQMRWKRAWFRETLRAAGFMWRRRPLMASLFYLGLILPLLGPAVVIRSLLDVPQTQYGAPILCIMGLFLLSCLMCCAYLFRNRARLWLSGLLFCSYYMLVLIWQWPWAVLVNSVSIGLSRPTPDRPA